MSQIPDHYEPERLSPSLEDWLSQVGQQLDDHARAGRNLAEVDFAIHGKHYSAFEVMTSFPVLMKSAARIRARKGFYWRGDDLKGGNPAYAYRTLERAVQAVVSRIRSGRHHLVDPMRISIPKIKPEGSIRVDDLAREWDQALIDRGDAKSRDLVIDSPDDRVLEGGISWVLTRWMSRKWSDQAVGSIPGISVPMILAGLEHAIRSSGRKVALTFDIKDFFRHVPVEPALRLLDREVGCSGDQRLKAHIERFSGRNGRWLAQGNPISPLLANVYGMYNVDPLLKRLGPAFRYVDDVVILFRALGSFAGWQTGH